MSKLKTTTKNSKLFLIIGLVIIFGLLIYGYFRAVPSQGNARIEITPKSFDFGEVEYGQELEYIFKVKNSGTEILEIKRVATSCACTKAKLKTQNSKLKSGEEVELVVTYDTGAMSGPHGKGRQERIIYIQSNDPINPQVEVFINAYVR